MVTSPFAWLGQSSRDDPHARATQSVGDRKQTVLDHTEQEMALLAIPLTPVFARHSKRVIKCQPCYFERHAMTGNVPGSFGVIPLEIAIFHDTTGYPYLAIPWLQGI